MLKLERTSRRQPDVKHQGIYSQQRKQYITKYESETWRAGRIIENEVVQYEYRTG